MKSGNINRVPSLLTLLTADFWGLVGYFIYTYEETVFLFSLFIF